MIKPLHYHVWVEAGVAYCPLEEVLYVSPSMLRAALGDRAADMSKAELLSLARHGFAAACPDAVVRTVAVVSPSSLVLGVTPEFESGSRYVVHVDVYAGKNGAA